MESHSASLRAVWGSTCRNALWSSSLPAASQASDALEVESVVLPYSLLAVSDSLIFIIKLFETTTSTNPLYALGCLINTND